MRPVYQRAPVALNGSEWLAFCAAAFAVALWGVQPILRLQADAVPPLLMTAIALACAALMDTLRAWVVEIVSNGRGGPESPAALPLGRGLVLSGMLVGAIGFYFIGLDWAPAARVTLITYVWPLMFVAASEVLTLGRVRGVVLTGCAVAFAGSAALIADGQGGSLISWSHAAGYLAGLLSGVCWVIYSLVLRQGRTLGPGAWPRLFTLGAVGALALHLAFEPSYWPIPADALAISALIGIGPYGLAFVAWAYGLRRGPARTVGALAYLVPFVASGILIMLGSAEPSWRFAFGGLAVVTGVMLANQRGRTA